MPCMPKNRFSQTAEGEPGLNYLCKGYYQFFKHVAPYMDFMKNELMNQRPPANIMEALKNGDLKIPGTTGIHSYNRSLYTVLRRWQKDQ